MSAKESCIDCVKADIKYKKRVTTEMTDESGKWRERTCCSDPTKYFLLTTQLATNQEIKRIVIHGLGSFVCIKINCFMFPTLCRYR